MRDDMIVAQQTESDKVNREHACMRCMSDWFRNFYCTFRGFIARVTLNSHLQWPCVPRFAFSYQPSRALVQLADSRPVVMK